MFMRPSHKKNKTLPLVETYSYLKDPFRHNLYPSKEEFTVLIFDRRNKYPKEKSSRMSLAIQRVYFALIIKTRDKLKTETYLLLGEKEASLLKDHKRIFAKKRLNKWGKITANVKSNQDYKRISQSWKKIPKQKTANILVTQDFSLKPNKKLQTRGRS